MKDDLYTNFGEVVETYNLNRPGYPASVMGPYFRRKKLLAKSKETDVAVIACGDGEKDCRMLLDLSFAKVWGVDADTRMLGASKISNPRFEAVHARADDFVLPNNGRADLFFFAQAFHTIHLNDGLAGLHANFQKNAKPGAQIVSLSYNPDIEHALYGPAARELHQILSDLPSYAASPTPLVDSRAPLFSPVFLQYLMEMETCQAQRVSIGSVHIDDAAAWLKTYSFGLKASHDEPQKFAEIVERLRKFEGMDIPFAATIYSGKFREHALSPKATQALNQFRQEMTAVNTAGIDDIRPMMLAKYQELATAQPELARLESVKALGVNQRGN